MENLLGILTDEFRPRFCLENLYVLTAGRMPESENHERGIPLVSFCDLPLSQTGFHLSVYGDYGIGMTKSWGRTHGISPVLYLYPEGSLSSRFSDLMARTQREIDLKQKTEWAVLIFDFAYFVKPYEGNLWREGGELTNIRFYNEREWRFVPSLPADFKNFLSKPEFLDNEIRNAANEKLKEMARISFEPNDIKYLIVRREAEIVPLIREIERIKGKYGFDDVALLSSRVISAEQIRTDF
jgi:hypothetical protein